MSFHALVSISNLNLTLAKLMQTLNYILNISKRNFFLALKLSILIYNLTREEQQATYNLKNDQSIVIKEANKGSAVVIWDKKDYLMEAEKQFSYKETYEKVSSDTSFFIKTIHDSLEKIWRGDVSSNILNYFSAENCKFCRFYLLP